MRVLREVVGLEANTRVALARSSTDYKAMVDGFELAKSVSESVDGTSHNLEQLIDSVKKISIGLERCTFRPSSLPSLYLSVNVSTNNHCLNYQDCS